MERHGYRLGYTVTRLALQAAGLVKRAPRRGAHRRKRPRRPLPGMLLHQDAARHAWLRGPAAARPGGHARRRDERGLLGLPGGGGGHRLELPGAGRDDRRPAACSVRSTPIAAATTSTPRSPAAGSTGSTRPRSAGRWRSSASSTSPPIRRRRAAARSGSSARCEDRLPKELALAGITDDRRRQRLAARGLPAGAQRPLRGGGRGARHRLRACRAGAVARGALPAGDPPGRQRQHRALEAAAACRSRRARSGRTSSRATVRLHEYPDGAVALFWGPHRIADFPPPAAERHDLAA